MADLSDKYEFDKYEVVPIDLKKIFNKPKCNRSYEID